MVPNPSLIPTPSTSHLTAADFDSVYEPAEDTFILLDALEADLSLLANSRVCLEIGSGSGCVSTFLGLVVGKSSARASFPPCSSPSPPRANHNARQCTSAPT